MPSEGLNIADTNDFACEVMKLLGQAAHIACNTVLQTSAHSLQLGDASRYLSAYAAALGATSETLWTPIKQLQHSRAFYIVARGYAACI